MKMKCDICNNVYEYSEKVIYHITAKINGVLKPHTHICTNCYEKLRIKTPEIIVKEKDVVCSY